MELPEQRVDQVTGTRSISSEAKQKWLQAKFTELLEMDRIIDPIWPEAHNTEQLFLVGSRNNPREFPCRYYLFAKSGEFDKVGRQVPLELY